MVRIDAQASGLPYYFSDTIVKEVGITELAHFISLQNPEEWAKSILSTSDVKRVKRKEEIIQSGYDMIKEIKKIQQIYLQYR